MKLISACRSLVTVGVWPLLSVLAASGCATKPEEVIAPVFNTADPIAVSAIRERAIQTIQNMAADADPQRRANAVEAASLAPTRLARVVQQGVTDVNPAVRTVAAMTIARAKLTALCDQTRPLLDDPSPHVRTAAIYALAACGAEVDRSPLATALLDDPSPRVRSQVAFILGELGDPSAIPLLRTSARERMSAATPEQLKLLELQVAEALIKLGMDSQRPVIRAALYPSRPDELEAAALAAQIIGEVNDWEAMYQLMNLADYRDSAGQKYPAEVRLAIAASLASMGSKRAATTSCSASP